MIDSIAEVIKNTPDYLIDNSMQMLVVCLALQLSKSKTTPAFILIYVIIMTITFGENGEYIENLEKMNPTWSYYNKQLAIIYLFESSVMILLGVTLMFNPSKLNGFTSIVIFSQSVASIVMAVYCYGYAVEILPYINNMMSYHYSLQSLFVILYCVIAWMCVYYSRKVN